MKKRPKIAILANFPVWLIDDSLPTFKGHYAVWLTALSEAFQSQNDFEIHWVALSKLVKQKKTIEHEGQYFHIIPRAKRLIGVYTFYWHDVRAIRRAVLSIKPDLIHAWGTEDCYGVAAKRIKMPKKLFSIQGLLNVCMQHGKMARFEELHSRYERGTLNAFCEITVESPWAMEQAKLFNPHANYHLFEYAVESRFFDKSRHMSQNPTCMFAGSDIPIKNVQQLIRVFSKPELAHIDLLLAGVSGTHYPNLPPNIKALGRVGRDEVCELLSQAWCLVHPSKSDTGPTVVKEARVLGLPIILTENCGSKQHVKEGKSGFIIGIDDDAALEKAVLTLCSSLEHAQKMGEYGRDHCRQILSSQHMAEQLLSIYRKLIYQESSHR